MHIQNTMIIFSTTTTNLKLFESLITRVQIHLENKEKKVSKLIDKKVAKEKKDKG